MKFTISRLLLVVIGLLSTSGAALAQEPENLSATAASACPNESRATRYYTPGRDVYIRNDSGQKFVLGTLFGRDPRTNRVRHDRFDVQYVSRNGWAWGRAYGSFNGDGWVLLSEMKRLDDRERQRPSQSPCHHMIPVSSFASVKNSKTINGEECRKDGTHTTVIGRPSIFGNYRNGTPSDERERGRSPLSPNQDVWWRYVTKDGRFVLLRTQGHDHWGFVPRGNVRLPNPPAETCP